MRVSLFKEDVKIATMDIEYDHLLINKHDSVVFQTEEGHSFSIDAYKNESINHVQVLKDEIRVYIMEIEKKRAIIE